MNLNELLIKSHVLLDKATVHNELREETECTENLVELWQLLDDEPILGTG